MDSTLLVLIIPLVSVIAILVFLLVFRNGKSGLSESQILSQFQSLSQDALRSASEQFLTLADQRLTRQTEANTREIDTKKQLIDQQLTNINTRLDQVSTLMKDTENKRVEGFTQLNTHLQNIGKQTSELTTSTGNLKEALSSSRARGQWGERMAEDILRLMGFVEGVNFSKQETINTTGTRPDFSFYLPDNLKVNMDVKFPFDNYLRFIEEENVQERDKHSLAFIRDVKNRIKEVSTREYIDPEGGTVDYVIMFIPNESIYSFIHETDPSTVDEALKNRVICCSPFTLFAVLAVIRQSITNFHIQSAARDIIGLMGRFNEEWKKFGDGLDTLSGRFATAQKQLETLTTTRKRALERPLNEIERLRTQQNIGLYDGNYVDDDQVHDLAPEPELLEIAGSFNGEES